MEERWHVVLCRSQKGMGACSNRAHTAPRLGQGCRFEFDFFFVCFVLSLVALTFPQSIIGYHDGREIACYLDEALEGNGCVFKKSAHSSQGTLLLCVLHYATNKRVMEVLHHTDMVTNFVKYYILCVAIYRQEVVEEILGELDNFVNIQNIDSFRLLKEYAGLLDL